MADIKWELKKTAEGHLDCLEWVAKTGNRRKSQWKYYYNPVNKAEVVAAFDAAQQFENRRLAKEEN